MSNAGPLARRCVTAGNLLCMFLNFANAPACKYCKNLRFSFFKFEAV